MLYAIGDIHGQHAQLLVLLARLPLRQGDRLVFLGDYIDHKDYTGNSRRVIDILLALKSELEMRGVQVVFLRGNHEQMLLNARQGPPPTLDPNQEAKGENPAKFWFRWGGYSTMCDYAEDWEDLPEEEYSHWWTYIPLEHWDFYESTELAYTEGSYYFVHAGVEPPGYKWQPGNSFQWPVELWIYTPRLMSHTQRFHVGEPALSEGRILVVGHTAWNGHTPLLKENLICVDTRAGIPDERTGEAGPLTAIRIDPEHPRLPGQEVSYQVLARDVLAACDVQANEVGEGLRIGVRIELRTDEPELGR